MSMTLSRGLLCALALGLSFQPVRASEQPKYLDSLSQADPHSADFSTGYLSNGLRYIVDRSPGKPVFIRLQVRGGATDNEADQPGAGHVVEHYLANPKPGTEFGRLIAAGVVKFESASFGPKNTQFNLSALTGYDGDPTPLVAVVREWLTLRGLDETSFNQHRAEVSSEVTNVGPDWPTETKFASAIYGYDLETLSLAENYRVSELTLDAARRFQNKWYHPRFATLIVSGDIDVGQWERAIQEGLESIPSLSSANSDNRAPNAFFTPRYSQPNRRITGQYDHTQVVRLHAFSKTPLITLTCNGEPDFRQAIIRKLAQAALVSFTARAAYPGAIVLGGAPSDQVISSELLYASFGFPVPASSEQLLHSTGKLAFETVSLIRYLHRYGVGAADIADARAELSAVIGTTWDRPAERVGSYADIGYLPNIPRLPDAQSARNILSDIRDDEVRNYIRRSAQTETDFDLGIVAPASVAADPKFIAAFNAGLDSGFREKLRPKADPVILKRLIEPPSTTPEGGKLALSVLDADTRTFRLAGGQQVLLHQIPARESGENLAITFVSRSDNVALMSGEQSYQYIETGLKIMPHGLDPTGVTGFLKRSGISGDLAVREDQSILTLSTDRGNLDNLLQVARIAALVDRYSAAITTSGSIALPSGASPLARASPWIRDDAFVSKVANGALAQFTPELIILSGNIAVEDAASLVSSYLSDIHTRSTISLPTRSSLSLKPGNVADLHGPDDQVAAQYILSAPVTVNVEVLQLLASVLRNAAYSRLREAGAYVATTSLSVWPFAAEDGASIADINLTFLAKGSQAERFNRIVDDVVLSVKEGKFSNEDFAKAKVDASAMIMNENNQPRIANFKMAEEFLCVRPCRNYKKHPDYNINEISKEKFMNFLKNYFEKYSVSRELSRRM